MVDKTTYNELKKYLEDTKVAIRSGRPRYALSSLAPLLDALFAEVFDTDAEPSQATFEPEPVTEEQDDPVEESLPTASELVDSNNRSDLDEIAKELGIEDPSKFNNKQDVADAIVAARK